MALIPGTLPTGTNFPGTPQALLNLFSSYLSAPPSKKALFVQASSTGVPTDGSAIWFNNTNNVVYVYVSGTGWVSSSVVAGSVTGSSIAAGAVGTSQLATGAITTAKIANNAITPGLLSTGGPSWDTSGNLTVTGKYYGDGTGLTLPATVQPVVPGSVVSFAMNTAPSGWLAANGSAISRTTYSALFTNIGTTFGTGDGSTTFNIPDLRGVVLRGWDNGRGYDPSRAFGSYQADQVAAHSHSITDPGHTHGYTSPFGSQSYYSGGYTGLSIGGGARGDSTTGASTGITINNNGTAAETTMKNVAVLTCIKY